MEVTNRFQELDLLEGLKRVRGMEVRDTVQKKVRVTKTTPKKKKRKKARWLSRGPYEY